MNDIDKYWFSNFFLYLPLWLAFIGLEFLLDEWLSGKFKK